MTTQTDFYKAELALFELIDALEKDEDTGTTYKKFSIDVITQSLNEVIRVRQLTKFK